MFACSRVRKPERLVVLLFPVSGSRGKAIWKRHRVSPDFNLYFSGFMWFFLSKLVSSPQVTINIVSYQDILYTSYVNLMKFTCAKNFFSVVNLLFGKDFRWSISRWKKLQLMPVLVARLYIGGLMHTICTSLRSAKLRESPKIIWTTSYTLTILSGSFKEK